MSKLYTMDTEQLERNFNTVKDKIIFALAEDGVIDTPAEEVAGQYIVVMHTRGRFGALFDVAHRLFTSDDDKAVDLTVLKVDLEREE